MQEPRRCSVHSHATVPKHQAMQRGDNSPFWMTAVTIRCRALGSASH